MNALRFFFNNSYSVQINFKDILNDYIRANAKSSNDVAGLKEFGNNNQDKVIIWFRRGGWETMEKYIRKPYRASCQEIYRSVIMEII